MADKLCLDKNFSTTQLLTKKKPAIENYLEDKLHSILFLPENPERKGEGGLRTKGYFKKPYEDKPLISIITVVFNGKKYLEQTIQSVINQTYDNVEYIIIDGASTDGTVDIIKKYEDGIDYWVSEPDRGIYDAMNKGIVLAQGEWINFMNAGDQFFDKYSLEKMCNHIDSGVDLLYGDAIMRYRTFARTKKIIPLNDIDKGMPFSHQSMFVRTKVHRDYMYDLKYSLCADYNFLCRVYVNDINFKKIDSILVSCSAGGLSDIQNNEMMRQTAEIAYYHFPKLSVKLIHKKKIIKNYIKNFFKRVLPSEMVENIKRLK